MLAILKRDTAAFVGTVSLRIPALEPNPWTTDTAMGILGYTVQPREQGNGLATEAAAARARCAFEEIGLAGLRATVSRDNVAAPRAGATSGST